MKKNRITTIENLETRIVLNGTAEFVGEINTTPSEEWSQHAWLDDQMFFVADDGTGDVELWKTDGTEAGTVRVKDIWPGPRGSFPTSLAATNSLVFFTAVDEEHGRELWVSDGTEVGTARVEDIAGNDSELARIGNAAVELSISSNHDTGPTISTRNGITYYWEANPSALWKRDGTQEGTVKLKDLVGPSGGGEFEVRQVASVTDGVVLVSTATGVWYSDGTSVQNVFETEFTEVSASISISGRAYFVASDSNQQKALWVTDGTKEGTKYLRTNQGNTVDNVVAIVDFNGALYLYGKSDGISGLWALDENLNSVELVSDKFEVLSSDELAVFKGKLYALSGSELWESDGTSEGTNIVLDFGDGLGESRHLIPADDQLFVYSLPIYNDPIGPVAIWSSDGTGENTRQLFQGTEKRKYYASALAVGNRLVFVVDNQLWASDGTTLGTQPIVTDLLAPQNDAFLFDTAGGNAFFESGSSLWKTDGTNEGTVYVADVKVIIDVGAFYASSIREQFYFSGRLDGDRELWRSDGTESGTIELTDVGDGLNHWKSHPQKYITESNGHVYFLADDGFHGSELYRLPLDVEPDPIPGDSNHDGIFNSADLVQVFQRAQYEDNIANNSTFEDGDWNGDGDFDSSDLVFAFQQGNYVRTAVRDVRNSEADLAGVFDFDDAKVRSKRSGRDAAIDELWQFDGFADERIFE